MLILIIVINVEINVKYVLPSVYVMFVRVIMNLMDWVPVFRKAILALHLNILTHLINADTVIQLV